MDVDALNIENWLKNVICFREDTGDTQVTGVEPVWILFKHNYFYVT
jgi:hypothetical protein